MKKIKKVIAVICVVGLYLIFMNPTGICQERTGNGTDGYRIKVVDPEKANEGKWYEDKVFTIQVIVSAILIIIQIYLIKKWYDGWKDER